MYTHNGAKIMTLKPAYKKLKSWKVEHKDHWKKLEKISLYQIPIVQVVGTGNQYTFSFRFIFS